MKKIWYGLIIATLALGMTACGSSNSSTSSNDTSTNNVASKNTVPIRIASMTDEESQIYGELMKQVLEANGYTVDSSGIGTYNNSTLPRQSLMEGQIDIVQDYTGRGMMFIEDVDESLYQKDLQTAFDTTKEADAVNGLEWLCYSPYNNTDGICVTKSWADENNIKTFEDFAQFVNNGGTVKLAIATENSYVATAPTCLPGWEDTYNFKLTENQLVVGVSDPLTMLANGTDGITAANCYTTGGTLDALDLYVLEDSEIVSPVYSPAAVTTKEFAEKNPELKEILEPVFNLIDETTIRDMNKRLSTDGENVSQIVSEFLKDNGIIK